MHPILNTFNFYIHFHTERTMKQGLLEKEKGFTLIEAMIVIAILGILAALSLPNYISYREKSFCAVTESDVDALKTGLADYFANPGNKTFAGDTGPSIHFTGSTTINMSWNNTGSITPIPGTNAFSISVTDQSGRCPISYRKADPHWSAGAPGIYSNTFQ